MKNLYICCKCYTKIRRPIYWLDDEIKLDSSFWNPYRKKWPELRYYYCCKKHFKEDSLWDSPLIPLNTKIIDYESILTSL